MFPNDFEDAIAYAFQAMTMGKFIVFYGQQVYGEYDKSTMWSRASNFPEGSYLRNPMGDWYIRIGCGWTPINLCDIPPEVRVNCLLMGIPV